MNQDELKAVYFGYFDQLPEPWATQAKENFANVIEKGISTPEDISEAINDGLWWKDTPQGYDYWYDIHNALEQGWNYLPALPTDTGKIYKVACFAEDGSEWIELCTFDDSLGRNVDQAHNLFTRVSQNITLNGLDLTPYAWRPAPPVTIPLRPL